MFVLSPSRRAWQTQSEFVFFLLKNKVTKEIDSDSQSVSFESYLYNSPLPLYPPLSFPHWEFMSNCLIFHSLSVSRTHKPDNADTLVFVESQLMPALRLLLHFHIAKTEGGHTEKNICGDFFWDSLVMLLPFCILLSLFDQHVSANEFPLKSLFSF